VDSKTIGSQKEDILDKIYKLQAEINKGVDLDNSWLDLKNAVLASLGSASSACLPPSQVGANASLRIQAIQGLEEIVNLELSAAPTAQSRVSEALNLAQRNSSGAEEVLRAASIVSDVQRDYSSLLDGTAESRFIELRSLGKAVAQTLTDFCATDLPELTIK